LPLRVIEPSSLPGLKIVPSGRFDKPRIANFCPGGYQDKQLEYFVGRRAVNIAARRYSLWQQSVRLSEALRRIQACSESSRCLP
jgi:hypothetical protein